MGWDSVSDPKVDHAIYSQQLTKLGKGYPLWQPEPTKYGEILIGDVGYIQEGAFYRLFNVLRDESDPINKLGVPVDFKPLTINKDRLLHETKDAIPPGPLFSASVQTFDVKLNANV